MIETTTTATPATCRRCNPPCRRREQCEMCGGHYYHDYVHWNGAFYQCEHCAKREAADPTQNGLDPIFGGTFRQGMWPAYEPYAPMAQPQQCIELGCESDAGPDDAYCKPHGAAVALHEQCPMGACICGADDLDPNDFLPSGGDQQ